MDLKKFHSLIKDISSRDVMIHNLDIQKELNKLFSNENFIISVEARTPFIVIKTKVPKDFLTDFLQIKDDMVSCSFASLDGNSYLIDCSKPYFKEIKDTCEVIDIANEEMKKIDSTEIDSEFNKVMIKEYTEKILDLVDTQSCKEEDLDKYRRMLNDSTIEDLRISERMLYIKTHPINTKADLSKIMGLEERCFEKIPIHSKYDFYVVDAKRWSSPKIVKPSYNPKILVELIQDIGHECEDEDIPECVSLIQDLSEHAFDERWKDMPDDLLIEYGIEDQVIAIAFNQYIKDAKEFIGEILGINSKLFIEVSGPVSTVLLIDARRWYLEGVRITGEVKWYH